MKLLSIVGARPQFIKLAPLLQAIESYNQKNGALLQHLTVHTGQHYDSNMSDIFFEELEMPHADVNLGVGSGAHGKQTGKMLEGIEEILLAEKPDWLVIFGDTNSTVAGALAAAKLHIPVAHIEAGLRSFNRRMPEEINRVVSDHISNILLAPTPTAMINLKDEGLVEKSVNTGDIMYDTVLRNLSLSDKKSQILENENLSPQEYYIATMHRAENTDDTQRLGSIMDIFNEVSASQYPVVFPMHPRTKHRIEKLLPDWKPHPKLRILEPVGYLDMLQLVNNARVALTDSGGLQKEVFFMNRPCITMRDETEWVETVSSGGNVITGADPEAIRQALSDWETKLQEGEADFTEQIHANFGKGDAAHHILQAILTHEISLKKQAIEI